MNYGKLFPEEMLLKHEVLPYSHFTCLKRSSIEKGKPRVKVEDRSVRLAIPHWGPGDSTPRDGQTTLQETDHPPPPEEACLSPPITFALSQEPSHAMYIQEEKLRYLHLLCKPASSSSGCLWGEAALDD